MRGWGRGPGLQLPRLRTLRTLLAAAILGSSATVARFGVLAPGAAAALLAKDRGIPADATALHAVGAGLVTGLVTGLGNVPRDLWLDGVDSAADGAGARWGRYRVRRGRWNAVRTAACALSAAGFALAV